MNAAVSSDLADFILKMTTSLSANSSIQGITKIEVLRYYRETKQAFINLGSLLISQTDGRFYFFNRSGELIGIDRVLH